MSETPLPEHVFLEGSTGTGKTAYAIEYLHGMLANGVVAENILVLVPQRTLGRPYQLAMHDSPVFAGHVTVLTLSGLARRSIDRFWPLVAETAGFADPTREPVFLTIETAQYYMRRFAESAVDEGRFDAVSIPFNRILAQLLDNMAKAAIAGFPFEEIADRLTTAWGDRYSSRPPVYDVSMTLGQEYRAFCLENNLLDYASQLEVFMQVLLPDKIFRRDFSERYQHLIADNVEEMGPLVHDFIRDWWEHWETALLIYDTDGGYRTFLGADPDNAVGLADHCDEHLVLSKSFVTSPDLAALVHEVQVLRSPVYEERPTPDGDPLAAIIFENHTYYPQMIDWVTRHVIQLVENGVPPREIAILAPFLHDSLRFSLQNRLETAGIPTLSHRPSRALRDEPAARALLTLLALAHPQWDFMPPANDVADALTQVIDGLDPIRAKLLTNIVYRPIWEELSSFERIQSTTRDRITYLAGERYEQLRVWLIEARASGGKQPPDIFLSRLFGEVLSQPGFGFHTNLESGRIAAQLIESARKFRQVLFPQGRDEWNEVGQAYLQLVNDGLLAALYTASWHDETADAVFMAPAFTFLMRNRFVDYQFWLDLGSQSWWERLDQPLTHPYVLTRHYPKAQMWTDTDEIEAQEALLYRLVIGLIRRCRQGIYLGIADLGEQGYEQRGPLLYLFQQILGRQGVDSDGE